VAPGRAIDTGSTKKRTSQYVQAPTQAQVSYADCVCIASVASAFEFVSGPIVVDVLPLFSALRFASGFVLVAYILQYILLVSTTISETITFLPQRCFSF
jgi:hypothetical protein